MPPENESPRSLKDTVSSISNPGHTGCYRSTGSQPSGTRGWPGSKIPWFWRMLGSWNRDQLALTLSSDVFDIVRDVIDVERVVDPEQEISDQA